MRKNKLVIACATGLLFGGLVLALAACTDSDESESFTVTPGAYLRRAVTGSGSISFTVTGIDMDLDRTSEPIVYFYDSKGYNDRGTSGGFQGDLCNYRLRYYGTHGGLESNSNHGYRFSSSQSYHVLLEWKTGNGGYVRSMVNGVVFEKPGAVADSFILGIGYPPFMSTGRSWNGAVYKDIVWPKGSTEIK